MQHFKRKLHLLIIFPSYMSANAVFMVKFNFWDHLLYSRCHGNRSCFKMKREQIIIQKIPLSSVTSYCVIIFYYTCYLEFGEQTRVQTWCSELVFHSLLLGTNLLHKVFSFRFQTFCYITNIYWVIILIFLKTHLI